MNSFIGMRLPLCSSGGRFKSPRDYERARNTEFVVRVFGYSSPSLDRRDLRS